MLPAWFNKTQTCGSSYRLLGTMIIKSSKQFIDGITPFLQKFFRLRSADQVAMEYQGNREKLAQHAFKLLLVRLAYKQHRELYEPDVKAKISDEFIPEMVQTMIRRDPDWISRALSHRDPDICAVKEVILGAAIRQNRTALVDSLLQAGVDPDRMLSMPKFSPRSSSIGEYTFVGVQAASDHFSVGSVRTNRLSLPSLALALQFALWNGYHHLAEILIRRQANVNCIVSCGNYICTPLFFAAILPDFTLALEWSKRLVSHGTELDAPSRPSALLGSIIVGNKQLTAWLPDNGASLTALLDDCARYCQYKRARALQAPITLGIHSFLNPVDRA